MASDHYKLADPSRLSTKAFGARLLLRLSFKTTIDLREDIGAQLDAVALKWCPHACYGDGKDRCKCAISHALAEETPCTKCSGIQCCSWCETDYRIQTTRHAGKNFATLLLTAWTDLGGRGAHTEGAWSRLMDAWNYRHSALQRSDRFFQRGLDVGFVEALTQDAVWKTAIADAKTAGRRR